MNARRIHRLNAPFLLRQGGRLDSIEIAYETWGTFTGDNAVLIVTGLSPSAHAKSSALDPSPGWWEEMIEPGGGIDPTRYFVVCVNSLGSCYGSTGPSSLDPATGEAYRLRFPVLSIEDIAVAAHEVVRGLGIERLHAVVGPSLGGMTALAYALLFSSEVKRLVAISSGIASPPFSIAIRSLQREAIRSDPEWRDGQYKDAAAPRVGMTFARKLGMISYRSAKEWSIRFGRERTSGASSAARGPRSPFGVEFEVEAYLEDRATKFASVFDPNCYLYLSRAMDLFDAGPLLRPQGEGDRRLADLRAHIIGVETDFLFPFPMQEDLALALRAIGATATLHRLESLQGHDSFLVDMGRFVPAVAEALNR